jgi:membrane-bound metal-dependent hydrolase YbcI (DUF457 family)
MTAVGHCLTGLSFASLVVPRDWARKRVAFAAFAFIATAPDFPLPFWGHTYYRVSHSLFVNLAVVAAVVGLLMVPRAIRSDPAWRWVLLGGAAAWMSHLLLDSFYSHGRGIRIFWPFSDAALALPIPWFHVLRPDLIGDPAALRIFANEAVCYGALLGVCLIWRWRWKPAPSTTAPGRPSP